MSFLMNLFSGKKENISSFESNVKEKDPSMLGFKFSFDDEMKANIMVSGMKKKGYVCSIYPKGKKFLVEIEGLIEDFEE